MKLARPAPLSRVVRTICLPDDEHLHQPLSSLQCVTSGWGRSGPSPSLSSALLEANVPLLELAECLKAYGKSVPIRDGHLCAGNTDGSSGSCVVSVNIIMKLHEGITSVIIISKDYLNLLVAVFFQFSASYSFRL